MIDTEETTDHHLKTETLSEETTTEITNSKTMTNTSSLTNLASLQSCLIEDNQLKSNKKVQAISFSIWKEDQSNYSLKKNSEDN